jgi:hypothetical protein
MTATQKCKRCQRLTFKTADILRLKRPDKWRCAHCGQINKWKLVAR